MNDERYAVSLPGLTLKNPFMPSSGAFYYGLDHMGDFDLNQLGALVLMSTPLTPLTVNPLRWIVNTKVSILNSVGLANPGIDAVAADFLPELAVKLLDLPKMLAILVAIVDELVQLAKIIDV